MAKTGCLMWSKISSEPDMEDMISKFESESDQFQFFVQNYQPQQEVWKTLVENEEVQMHLDGDHLTIFYPVYYLTDERLHIMNQVYRGHT